MLAYVHSLLNPCDRRAYLRSLFQLREKLHAELRRARGLYSIRRLVDELVRYQHHRYDKDEDGYYHRDG